MNFSLTDIKKNNLRDVFNYIYNHPDSSKRQISTDLNISIPTVNQHINELINQHLIMANGFLDSNYGRKAVAYSLIPDSRISIGIEILNDKVGIIAINLLGEILAEVSLKIKLANTDKYLNNLKYAFITFLEENHFQDVQILGVGISVQGFVSDLGRSITYGIIDFSIDEFEEIFGLPCQFIHDTDCAANMELWIDRELRDAIYLSVGNRLGGALIIDRKIQTGMTGKTGSFEHMTLMPDGGTCYCGRRGCADIYCSGKSFLKDGMEWDEFFYLKSKNNCTCIKLWGIFLNYLSVFINNLHTAIECDIIIGGRILSYITTDDIAILQKKTNDLYLFETTSNYIYTSKYKRNAMLHGSALVYMQKFLNTFSV